MITAVVLIVVLVAGMVFTQCNQDPNRTGMTGQPNVITLAKIGETVISLNEVAQGADMMLQNVPMDQGIAPDMLVQAYQAGLFQAANRAVVLNLAKKKGVVVTPEEVQESLKKSLTSQVEGQFISLRSQFIQQQKLKVNATDEEFAKLFEKEFNTDLASAKQRFTEQLEAENKLPERIQQEEQRLYTQKTQTAYESAVKIGEAEYIEQEKTYVTKRIFVGAFTDQGQPNPGSFEKVKEAQTAIAGGMSFEAAMEKFSKDPAPAGKKKSDSTVNLTAWNMTYDEAYEGMKDLKPGQQSKIISLADGAAIFKIIEIKPFVKPKDWDKQKVTLLESRTKEMASKQLNTDMRALIVADTVKWDSPSAELMLDWTLGLITPEFRFDKEARKKRLAEFYEKAKSLDLSKEPADPKLVAATRYGIFKQYYDSLTTDEQKKMLETRLEELTAVLGQANHAPTRMELAQMLLDNKDVKGAADQLAESVNFLGGSTPAAIQQYESYVAFLKKLDASGGAPPEVKERIETVFKDWKNSLFEGIKIEAESNADYGPAGQQAFSDLNGRILNLKTKGLINAEQVKILEDVQAKWKTEKAAFDAEEAKKAAEAKKNAQDTSKPPTKPDEKAKPAGETKTGN